MSKHGVKITTKPFRLAFPEVFEPKAFKEGDKKKYSINMIFEPGSPGIQEIRKALFQAAKNRWGEDRNKWPMAIRKINFATHFDPTAKNGFPVRDGDTVSWDGYASKEFLKCSCSEKFAPGVVDTNRQPILDQKEVFGGLICRASIFCDVFDGKESQGVTVYLQHLQVLKDDGTRFSGSRAEDEFDDWSETEADPFD